MRVAGVTISGAFSGADSEIFAELNARKHLTAVVTHEIPALWNAFFLLTSFHLNRRRWFSEWRRKVMKSPRAFALRTAAVARQLRDRDGEIDVVLQVSGLFAPYPGRFLKPVTLFCDYTTKLAERNYSPWFGLRSSEVNEWYDLETEMYSKCAMIFTASENTRSSLIKDYQVRPECVRTVGEGVRAMPVHRDSPKNEPVVLMIGLDFERKGGLTLLEAFSKVRKALPNARLVIVGPSHRFDQEGVSWLGQISDRRKLDRLFADASVFAMPSFCEPFGLALIEAMSHGLPVLGSRVDAMSEIIQDGKTGYLIDAGDDDELANRLIELLSSPEQCKVMGLAGRSRVESAFMWGQVVDRIEQGLREVTGS
jgi:glycosyltransferase involved in cell wall biosynthesis